MKSPALLPPVFSSPLGVVCLGFGGVCGLEGLELGA